MESQAKTLTYHATGRITRLDTLLEAGELEKRVRRLAKADLPKHALTSVTLLAPVDQQEVWAVGVTYLRSKAARMEEPDFRATAYDRGPDAPPGQFVHGLVAHWGGEFVEAVAAFERAADTSDRATFPLACLGTTYADWGKLTEARAVHAEIQAARSRKL